MMNSGRTAGETIREAKTGHGPGDGSVRQLVTTFLQPLAGGLLALVTVVGLIGLAIQNPRPHDIKVGLVGPTQAVQQLPATFDRMAPGAFSFKSYSTEEDARAAIDSRSIDGALVLGNGRPRLIVAGAAGDAVAGLITSAFKSALGAQGQPEAVETVHPFAKGDPHGLVLFFVVLAVLVSTLVAQAVAGLRRDAPLSAQVGVVVAYAVVAAPVAMGMATWIAGDYGSGFWGATGLVALASAAIGSVVAGSARLLGAAGVALAAAIVVLLDLVSSGGPLGTEFLPDFYRWIAPAMPAGQLYAGMRGALYFDGAGAGIPIAVLCAWLAGGLVLMGLGRAASLRRSARAVARLAPAQ